MAASEAKITVLISTSTLAWGVNFPAHLVMVEGFFRNLLEAFGLLGKGFKKDFNSLKI